MASYSTAVVILNVASRYSLYTTYVIFIGGIIGNTLNILIFVYLKVFRKNQCGLYLTVESIVDNVYLILYLITSILPAVYGYDSGGYSVEWCRARSIFFQTCSLISISTVCFAACDQFFSTNHQYGLRQICSLKLARSLIIIFSCFWFVHSIIYGIFLTVKPSLGCIISDERFLQYSSFFFYPVLSGLLPILISSSFSLLAYHNVRHIVRQQIPIVRRRFDQQMTAMVLIRVMFFVILVSPYIGYRIYAVNVIITPADLLQYAISTVLHVLRRGVAVTRRIVSPE